MTAQFIQAASHAQCVWEQFTGATLAEWFMQTRKKTQRT